MWKESGLHFSFAPGWEVIRWDSHTYYQGLSSSGLKGVDFIAYQRKGAAFLMEVKNFRQVMPPPPATLADEFIRKGQDTLRGVDAIYAFLRRSPIRKNLIPFWRRIPPEWSERAWWTQAGLAFSGPGLIPYLLWVEGEQVGPEWRANLQAHLPEKGSPFQFRIAGSTVNPLSHIVVQVE